MRKRFDLRAGIACLVLMMGASHFAHAQEKTFELKLAHWLPSTHPLHKAIEEWGASVEKASSGTLKYNIYPSQQLGKAFDHYDMARDGIADLAYINPGYQPGRFPIIGAAEMPFLMTNGKGGSQGLDAWYRKYAAKEMKDVKFCLAFVHDPGAFHSKSKKIVVPDDLKGMKVRPSHATMASLISLLGGSNVQSSAPEARDLLEKGVAEALTFPWGSLPVFGIDKVTKYHMDAPLYVTTFAFVFNPAAYSQMSASQKKVIDEHCSNDWALRVGARWSDSEHVGLTKLKSDPSREVYRLTDAELAEWRKASAPLQDAWARNVKRAGGDPDEILKELKDSLANHKSAF
jgi:TRAP-type C4-dicarboxylate transport system substrate-binding protein